MSAKGSITKANYIDYDKALNKSRDLMKQSKTYNFGLYVMVAINSGLRIGDILKLRYSDFENGSFTFREQKTSKSKTVKWNDKILNTLKSVDLSSDKLVFTSQKGSAYSIQQINRLIKKHFKSNKKNYSSHSLRKSFGRRVYEMDNESERSLVMLSQIYNHSSLKVTRTYLDITQDELNDIYLSI